MDELKLKFHRAMLGIYQTAKKDLGYNANRFVQMLTSPDESVRTAKKFVLSNTPSDGFSELWKRGRMDLTVEALVAYHEEFSPIFSDSEKNAARNRLLEMGYKPS
ncbi:hypothetical protein [Paenibacillus silviterrae]|uniref:hypothetical protein n=1 Tax=Paenibacillus silviterrae TaxID=3242194 RepID=UPI002543125F|nr:hypothetical protein [Paenibacillus chinjuensis]